MTPNPWHQGANYQEDFWDAAKPRPRILGWYCVAAALFTAGFLLAL